MEHDEVAIKPEKSRQIAQLHEKLQEI